MIRLPKITSLYGRIFAIFWFTMFLVLMAVLALPHLDPRKSHDIDKNQLKQLDTIKHRLELRFAKQANLEVILRRLEPHINWDTKPSQRHPPPPHDGIEKEKPLVFITTLDGTLLSPNKGPSFIFRILKNFVTAMDDPAKPQQKLYGRLMLSGPVPIKLAGNEYLLYLAQTWHRPPPLLLRLFDHPWQLLLAVMLVSTPLLLWLAWALSQPARRLEKAAQRVAKGEFEIDPSLEKGSSEFRQAGASFNQMVKAVNEMISRQQRLLSDISHELRSPLTRLRMAQAIATRKQGDSQELTRIDTEAQRLELMIAKLLELSHQQVNSHNHREEQPLESLWEAMLEDAQFEAEQMGKNLTFTPVPKLYIRCQPALLISALENVVRNAIYYGNHKIHIMIEVKGNRLRIIVEDDGEGVPEEELNAIFRPFYRVSTARDRHSGGTGLGLAICESAILQHNGTIRASKSSLGGLQVEVQLPLD